MPPVVAACQIDLIGVPQPASAERPMAAPNGGFALLRADYLA
jgi:hypothetical protein